MPTMRCENCGYKWYISDKLAFEMEYWPVYVYVKCPECGCEDIFLKEAEDVEPDINE